MSTSKSCCTLPPTGMSTLSFLDEIEANSFDDDDEQEGFRLSPTIVSQDNDDTDLGDEEEDDKFITDFNLVNSCIKEETNVCLSSSKNDARSQSRQQPLVVREVDDNLDPAIESNFSIPWYDLLKDVVDGIAVLQYVKTIDPYILRSTMLQSIMANSRCMHTYSSRVTRLENERYSSSLLTYQLRVILPWFARELDFLIECLNDFHNGTLQNEAEYHIKVLRADDCSFWHSSGYKETDDCYDVCTINVAHQVLFDLDFFFNIMRSDHIVTALRNVEDFLGKVYGTLLVIPPFLVDMHKPCSDCIIQDTMDYKLPNWTASNCTHLYDVRDSLETDSLSLHTTITTNKSNRAELIENTPGDSGYSPLVNMEKVGFDHTLSDFSDATGCDISVQNTTRVQKQEQAIKFYNQLNATNKLNYTHTKATNEKLLFKAKSFGKFVNDKKISIYPKWQDAIDSLFTQDLLEDRATLLFCIPFIGLTAHELIQNHVVIMEDKLLQLKHEEERFVKESLNKANFSDAIAAKAREIYSVDTLIRMLEGTSSDDGTISDENATIPGSLAHLIRNIAKKQPDDSADEAKRKVLEQYGNLINNEILELHKKLNVVNDTLKKAINPPTLSGRVMQMAHKIRRAVIATELFTSAILGLPKGILSELPNMTLFSDLTSKIDITLIAEMSEKIKYCSLGPIYRDSDSDQYLPLRKGFTLFTVWSAKDLPACSNLNFKNFCELADISAGNTAGGEIVSFKLTIEILLKHYGNFHIKREEYSQKASKYLDVLYQGFLHKVRLAVVVMFAYNIRYGSTGKLKLCMYDSERNIRCGMDGKEFSLLEPGLYIGTSTSPYYLVYYDMNDKGVKKAYSSYDIIELCTIFLKASIYTK